MNTGDTVKYSRNFLQSICALSGALPHATGTIKEIEKHGTLKLAVIAWDTPEAPKRVNVKNLVAKSRVHLERH